MGNPTRPLSVFFQQCSIFFEYISIPISSLYFSCSSLDIMTSHRIPVYFYWKMVLRDQDMGTQCAHCYWRSLVLGFSMNRVRTCMLCTLTCGYTNIYSLDLTCVYIKSHKFILIPVISVQHQHTYFSLPLFLIPLFSMSEKPGFYYLHYMYIFA